MKTEAGRKKILCCVRDLVQLHGNPGNAEVIGIDECNKIVKDFEKLFKAQAPGVNKADVKEESQDVKEEPAAGPSGSPVKDASDGDDDLAIEMPGGSPNI